MSDSTSAFSLTERHGLGTVGSFAALQSVAGVDHLVTTARSIDPQAIRHQRDHAAVEIAAGMDLPGVAWCTQVHQDSIHLATSGGHLGEGDAVVTNRRGLGLMVVSADCPLILLADTQSNWIGAVHASWRSTAGRLAGKTVELLTNCGVDPVGLVACIAPSAGPCCYEVGPEVRQEFVDRLGRASGEWFAAGREDRWMLDLWRANTDQLCTAGLPAGNIHRAGVCTICGDGTFPSHRREGDAAGRFAAVIARR